LAKSIPDDLFEENGHSLREHLCLYIDEQLNQLANGKLHGVEKTKALWIAHSVEHEHEIPHEVLT